MTPKASSRPKVAPPPLSLPDADRAPGESSRPGFWRTVTVLLRGRCTLACFVSLGGMAIGALLTQPLTQPLRYSTILAASAGFLLALGVVLIVAVLDNRILWPQSELLGELAAPLLGAVPTVLPKRNHTQRAELAALCIHEIRALLQVRAEVSGTKAFAITAPSRGAGKTSLTVGLASSLALSGRRTLMVDCDLSQRLATSDAVSSATVTSKTHPNRSDLTVLNSRAQRSQSIDQVMLAMGCVNRQDRSLFRQSGVQDRGLPGVLNGVPLARCVVDMNIPGLSLLPALAAQAQDIGRMSHTFMNHLIQEAESGYDMILFDTGPIPGSVEALFVTSAADAVILVVPWGESLNRLDRTITYLRMVGAHLSGTVFNRASPKSLNLTVARRTRCYRRHAHNAPPGGKGQTHRTRPKHTTGAGVLLAAVQLQSNGCVAQIGQIPPPGRESPHGIEPGATGSQWASAEAADITKELLDDATRHERGELRQVEAPSRIGSALPKQARRNLALATLPDARLQTAEAHEAVNELDAQILELLDDVTASSAGGSKFI